MRTEQLSRGSLALCFLLMFVPPVLGQDATGFAANSGLTAADIRLLADAALNAGTDPGTVVRIAGYESQYKSAAAPCNQGYPCAPNMTAYGSGLPQCSAHGVRKASAARAAENGATTHQLMAMFGWLSVQEAERYTRAAERKQLAKDAPRLLKR